MTAAEVPPETALTQPSFGGDRHQRPTGDPARPVEAHRSSSQVPRRRTYSDLSVTRCHQLIAAHQIGRVAWSAADGPQLFPVSYAWIDGRIVFRTSPYGILSELVRRTAAVFEVDEIDETRRRGWSVIIRGRAGGIASPDQLRSTTPTGTVPWADGDRYLVIAIEPVEVTGREFRPVTTDDDD